jgi:Flp pilus assembly protein TadD
MRRSHVTLAAVLALLAGFATAAAAAPKPAAKQPAKQPAEAAAPATPDEALSPRAQRLFDEAVGSVEEQKKLKVPLDWALLERKWRNVLDATDAAEAHYNLGVALERQGKLQDAREQYRIALARKPTLRQAAVNLAVIAERDADPRLAAETYARIASDFPEDAVSRARLAALYLASGQAEDAWRLAREALLRDPESVGAQKVMTRVALARGSVDLAKLLALRAQKLDDKDPELPFLSGQILSRQGDEAAAAVQYRKALALDDRYAPARHALLDAAVRSESWVNVVEQARAVLKDEPKNAPVQLALGIALRNLGKPDDAAAAYDEAQRLSGDKLPEVHLARGVLLMKVKSECEPAIAEFKAYVRGVGPVLPGDAPALKLQRECEQILDENKRAAEAAKQMQADAARKAAEDAAKKASVPGSGAGQGGSPAPTSAPTPR